MTTAKRDELLSLMMLVRSALATQSFIPAWTHIRLAEGSATTYNDTASISVKTPLLGMNPGCVPGELFIKALSSFNADSVLLQEHPNERALVVTSGRSKLKIPTLPVEDFKMPVLKGAPASIDLNDDILAAIGKCLFSVGTDPTHPEQMGVTLGAPNGLAVLYSTDNMTISRCATKSAISLPGDAPVILPTFFCEQLLSLAKAYIDDDIVLNVYPGALQVVFGKKATLLTKTLVDMEVRDFEDVIKKYLDIETLKAATMPIPKSFDAAFNRAMLILALETDKATTVTPSSEGVTLFSKSSLGESDDEFTLDKKVRVKPFKVDPGHVLRAAKSCGSVAFYDRVLVLCTPDISFVHLVAHCA